MKCARNLYNVFARCSSVNCVGDENKHPNQTPQPNVKQLLQPSYGKAVSSAYISAAVCFLYVDKGKVYSAWCIQRVGNNSNGCLLHQETLLNLRSVSWSVVLYVPGARVSGDKVQDTFWIWRQSDSGEMRRLMRWSPLPPFLLPGDLIKGESSSRDWKKHLSPLMFIKGKSTRKKNKS